MTGKAKITEELPKLGKNPFEKNGRSRVGRMIEANFVKNPELAQKVQVRSLFERIQQMNISLNVKELFGIDHLGSLKDRLK